MQGLGFGTALDGATGQDDGVLAERMGLLPNARGKIDERAQHDDGDGQVEQFTHGHVNLSRCVRAQFRMSVMTTGLSAR